MGNKITRNDPLHRRFISWAYHHSMRFVFGFQVHDVDCDFRLIKRHVFERVVLTQNSGVIALELMTKVQLAGFRTVEVPVNHYHRAYGVSQFFRPSNLLRGGGQPGQAVVVAAGAARGGDARSRCPSRSRWGRPVRAAPGPGHRPAGRRRSLVKRVMVSPLRAFEGKRCLVTGGLGFIGSNLARRLVELGARVTLADSLIPAYGGNLFNMEGIRERVHVSVTDVRDPHAMQVLVRGQDYIFNLAGQIGHLESMEDPQTDLRINTEGPLTVLEACRRSNPQAKVVYASTRTVYGRPLYLPVNESHPLQPIDCNAVSNVAAEHYHRLYFAVHGVRTVCLRLTNTYGPRQMMKDAQGRYAFIYYWIRRIIDGDPLQIMGGHQVRDFTYVDDCVDALLLAAAESQADGEVYNLGGEAISLRLPGRPADRGRRGRGERGGAPAPPSAGRSTPARCTSPTRRCAGSWDGSPRWGWPTAWPGRSPSTASTGSATGTPRRWRRSRWTPCTWGGRARRDRHSRPRAQPPQAPPRPSPST